MKKFFIIFGITAVAGFGMYVGYRKFLYVPKFDITFEPDWTAQTVKYNVMVDGKNYISGTAALKNSTQSGTDYGIWKLDIVRYASMPNIPSNKLTFEITARGKKVLTEVVDFDARVTN